jgi:8-oxo-dGTP pyrophosphatase MutT (NUDIX family)
MKFKKIWEGDWVSIVSPVEHDYEALHEMNGVLIVPILYDKDQPLIGIRKEFCPPYFIKGHKPDSGLFYTAISGGVEDKEDPETAAFRELKEEAGIIPISYSVTELYKEINFVKNTDALSSCYLMKIYTYDKEKPKGDGTENEEKSKTIWVSHKRLKTLLKEKNIDLLFHLVGSIANGVL